MARPVKLTITVDAGAVAWDRLEQLKTEDEKDIRLTVEKALQRAINAEAAGDPYSDPMGVFVEEIEVTQ